MVVADVMPVMSFHRYLPLKQSIAIDSIQLLDIFFGDFEVLRGYYNKVEKKLKPQNYRQRQKALNEMRKCLFSGSDKYRPDKTILKNGSHYHQKTAKTKKNRPIIVAFGSVRFGNLRGTVPFPTKKFKAALLNHIKKPAAHIQRNDFYGPKYVVVIDEYLASQICPICKTRTTSNQVDTDNLMIHSVLNCQSCDTRWNIFLHMAENNNDRPKIFQRERVYFKFHHIFIIILGLIF